MSEPSAPAKKTRRDSLQDLLGTALLGLTLAPGMAKAEEEITEKVGGGDGLPDQCVVVRISVLSHCGASLWTRAGPLPKRSMVV